MRPFCLAIGLVCIACLFPPSESKAQHCNGFGGQSFGVQSFGFQQPVFVNSFGGVHSQFQRNGFVGVSAFPVQSFAAPVFVNSGFNRGNAVNVNVNSRRSFFRPQRTNVNVNRFGGGVRVNVR